MNRDSIIVVSTRPRDMGRLDCIWNQTGPQPSLEAIRATADAHPGPLVIGGGEPTLRPDFPELIAALGRNRTIRTDGLALSNSETVKRLNANGLDAVRVPIHSARSDAHDWLVGLPGAHKRIRRTVATLLEAGIGVEAEVTVTRPTTPYLEETAAFLLKMGIRTIRFRMLKRVLGSDTAYVTTAPRFGLLQPSLDAAVRTVLRAGADAQLEGLPNCAIPGFKDLHIDHPTWLLPAGVTAPLEWPKPSVGCKGCDCTGAPTGYVNVFGWTEFQSERADSPTAITPVAHPESGEDAKPPPPRSGRQPATRISDILRLSDSPNVGGDPLAGRSTQTLPDLVAVHFPIDEPTRSIKKRLVEAAQQGAETLQVVGPLDHPEAFPLLREALRLSFGRVVVTSRLGDLSSLSDKDLFKLREIASIWTTDEPASLDVAKRLKERCGVDFVVVKTPVDMNPVLLFGTPEIQAEQDEAKYSWPKWTSTPVN